MIEEFEAGLYISEAEDIVKCPYCNGYAEYHLRTGGSRYYLCPECGNDVDITSEKETYYGKIELTQEDANELFSFVYSLGGREAHKVIKSIQDRHRKAMR